MTPVPLTPPLAPAEAAELAHLILAQAERRKLDAGVRARIAARAGALRLERIRPHFGSLARDPVHHSSYYLAVDGDDGAPQLLHIAPASAPTSSVFGKPLLVGRSHQRGGEEIVVNSVPFGPGDQGNIEKFVSALDPAFLPQPGAVRSEIRAASPAAFAGFQTIWKTRAKNLAALGLAGDSAPAPFYYASLWGAIRCGWREGYGMGIALRVAGPEHVDAAHERIRAAARFTRFAVDVAAFTGAADHAAPPAEAAARRFDTGEAIIEFSAADLARLAARFGPALRAAERLHETARQARATLPGSRAFDFEFSLASSPMPTAPAELLFCLEWLKSAGRAAHLAAPALPAELARQPEQLRSLAAVARLYHCTLSIDTHGDDRPETLEAVARATAGRYHYQASRAPETCDDYPAYIAELARNLAG
ncbi:MAG: hypothetical protein ACLQVN_10725 [Bryobacteraceae bacterium]